jgi:hypothetical protein
VEACTVSAAQLESWLREPTEAQLQGLSKLHDVPQKDIYEVVPTQVGTAIVWHLAKVPIALLTCSEADFLAGGHYNCALNMKPVLVRAVYGNGGTGSFAAKYDDSNNLYIIHGSLGEIAAVTNLPLILSLASVPGAVYSWVGSAK